MAWLMFFFATGTTNFVARKDAWLCFLKIKQSAESANLQQSRNSFVCSIPIDVSVEISRINIASGS